MKNRFTLISAGSLTLRVYKPQATLLQLIACLYDGARPVNILHEDLIKTHIIEVWIPEHVCLTEFLNDPFA